MQELIKLRTFCAKEKEYAISRTGKYSITPMSKRDLKLYYKGEEKAYSSIIGKLDLILNNSVVKPTERRSPTDESFGGCKPPDERQNPPSEKVEFCFCGIAYKEVYDERIRSYYYHCSNCLTSKAKKN